MALIDRLNSKLNDEFKKLSIHKFIASLQEYILGRKVKSDITIAFKLDSADELELDSLLAKIDAKPVNEKLAYIFEIWGVLILAESGDMYDETTDLRARLGL